MTQYSSYIITLVLVVISLGACGFEEATTQPQKSADVVFVKNLNANLDVSEVLYGPLHTYIIYKKTSWNKSLEYFISSKNTQFNMRCKIHTKTLVNMHPKEFYVVTFQCPVNNVEKQLYKDENIKKHSWNKLYEETQVVRHSIVGIGGPAAAFQHFIANNKTHDFIAQKAVVVGVKLIKPSRSFKNWFDSYKIEIQYRVPKEKFVPDLSLSLYRPRQ